MTTQEIVSKLWNLCNVLRDDGITYHQYVTELTYILFLKMAKETGTEEQIPEKYRWDELKAKSGVELKKFYKELLSELGDNGTGRIREIYQGAATNIDEPKNLEKIIATIDSLDWYSAREEGLGNLYEGLLEKNANEKKSGAGQYFTPRVLIDVMTKLMKPQVGERCNDPACGTFGFMIAAHQYVAEHTDNFFDIEDADMARFEREEAFTGCELVHDTHRLALMNSDSGYIFLSAKNITTGKINWNDIMYIPKSLHDELYSRVSPKMNDILLAKNGTTGVAAIVDRECEFDIYVTLALLRVVNNNISSQYLLKIIASDTIQDYFKSSLKGIGVPNLHLEHIRTTLIPIPPINEQNKIAERIYQYYSLLDSIVQNIE